MARNIREHLQSKDSPCLIIGEVAQSHDGSLGQAHAFIDAIAKTGADAVKFQTHIAAAESTPDEPWRVKFSLQDETRYDYWKRMEFTEDQWRGLKQHAEEQGLIFLSSPFSLEALEMLERLDISAWKVASGEVSNRQLLDRMIRTRLPVLLSTGLSPLKEIDETAAYLKANETPLAVLQCTTAYPCLPERVGLNLIPFFQERYECPVGLSDHSGTIYAGVAAAAFGIAVLEVHVALSREMFGPDVIASVTTDELRQLVEGVRFTERMRAGVGSKDRLAEDVAPLRSLFTRSIVARVDLPKGTTLLDEHIALKKPGTGLPPERVPALIGRRLSRDVKADQLLQEADLERKD